MNFYIASANFNPVVQAPGLCLLTNNPYVQKCSFCWVLSSVMKGIILSESILLQAVATFLYFI